MLKKIFLILSLVFGLVALVLGATGGTWTALLAGLSSCFTLILYAAEVEDTIKYGGVPNFW